MNTNTVVTLAQVYKTYGNNNHTRKTNCRLC